MDSKYQLSKPENISEIVQGYLVGERMIQDVSQLPNYEAICRLAEENS